MELPLVSILVPIYRVENYIERCARSVFEQTYDNLEFVFCNDCTPDASIQVLEHVMKDYPQLAGQIRIIHHKRNKGLAAARNTLVANCKGDFIFHVDSDDWVERNAVDLLVAKQIDTDADIVTGRAFSHYKYKVQEHFIGNRYLDKNTIIENILKGKDGAAVWCRLIKRELYTNYKIKCLEGVDCREDFQVIIPLIYFSRKVSVIDSFIYHYNKTNKHSICHNYIKSHKYKIQTIISRLVILLFFLRKNRHFMWVSIETIINKTTTIRL